ncbi:hypothetical protein GCM10009858_41770 [Terrabacter carboxydivorans]|uniref:Uncharacterized protein n=1 Tax=Terrabacter carboxydivorans TaxID=619730 RepID=A0ABN3MBM2_9MICO
MALAVTIGFAHHCFAIADPARPGPWLGALAMTLLAVAHIKRLGEFREDKRLHCLCPVPGLMEALISRKDESHGSTEEVPGGASGASDQDGRRSAA